MKIIICVLNDKLSFINPVITDTFNAPKPKKKIINEGIVNSRNKNPNPIKNQIK